MSSATISQRALLLFVLFFMNVLPCYAQNVQGLYQWSFGGGFVGSSLPTCQSMTITIISKQTVNNVQATPPYSLMVFPIGGTPRTYLLGSDEAHLTFALDFRPDTKFLTSVTDAKGNIGGVGSNVYGVLAGKDTSCVKDDAPSDFTISANVTDKLNTCDPWGVTVKGGTGPYTFSLVAQNAPVITNVSTVTADQDELVYINRADPGKQLLAVVTDSTGKLAYGSPNVTTQGSTNIDCTGLETTVGKSSDFAQQEQDRKNHESNKTHTTRNIIIGAIIGALATIALLAAVFFIRRRRQKRTQRHELDLAPRMYNQGTSGISFPPSPNPHQQQTTPLLPPSVRYTPMSPGAQNGVHDFSPYAEFGTPPATATSGGFGKRYEQQQQRDSAALTPYGTHHSGASGASGSSSNVPLVEEVVVQHQDAGEVQTPRIVRELPPPYMPRTDLGEAEGSMTPGSSTQNFRVTPPPSASGKGGFHHMSYGGP